MEIDIILVDVDQVQKTVNEQLDEFQKGEESEEDYLNRIIKGEENEKRRVFQPKVDVKEYANIHTYTFRLDDTIAVYRPKTTFRGKEVAVINIAGREYDWIFEQEKFDKIRNYLNSKDE